MEDRGAHLAGHAHERGLVVVAIFGAGRKLLGLVGRERGLAHHLARDTDGIGRHALVALGRKVIELQRWMRRRVRAFQA
jgi:hypothetical protein